MNHKNLFRMTCIPILLALFVSTLAVTPALADDGIPPTTETPVIVETTPPTTETTVAEEEIPAGIESPLEENVQQEVSAPEILASVPEGTDIIVVSEAGEIIPLATQAAADAIDVVDPVWCPVGVKPQNGVGGCTNAYGNLQELVDALYDGSAGVAPNKSGIIWIEKGDLNDNTYIVLDGSYDGNLDLLPDLGVMSNYSLTLQGGWNGTFGSTLLDTADPYSYFTNMSLSILNWKGAVTINNIVINTETNAGTDNPTLTVRTTKNIVLNNVHLSGNEGNDDAVPGVFVGGQGALLDTKAALKGYPASITVNNSSFSNNYGTGLYIKADGAVTLKNVTAVNNGGDPALNDYGVYIENWITSDNLNQPVTISGTSNQFVGNIGTGLAIHSFGAVTLANITAYGNTDGTDDGVGDGYGVYINNNHDTSTSVVRITGTNLFNNNQINGLAIYTNGVIALNSITAEFNGNSFNDAAGALLDNCLSIGAGCTTVSKSVVLSGINKFNNNYDSGLIVTSSGPINISNIMANYNGNDGVNLDNCLSVGAGCTTVAKSVVLSGINKFNNNYGNGLIVTSSGPIRISNLTANYNGNISNDAAGVLLDNCLSVGAGCTTVAKSVVLSGINKFNNNYDSGLIVTSSGLIIISNLTANYNGNDGANLDNCHLSGTTPLVNRPICYVTTSQYITLSGSNWFLNNEGDGLHILTTGAVTISNVTANNNLGDGVDISNDTILAKPQNVIVKGVNSFNNNGFGVTGDGLKVYSYGSILLNSATANDNVNNGAFLDNRGYNSAESKLISRKNVIISGINRFDGNGAIGLDIGTVGTITIYNLYASDNGQEGAYLKNFLAWKPSIATIAYAAPVILYGFGYFDGNGYDGLKIESKGAISLINLIAQFNGDDGVDITTAGELAIQKIAITGSNLFNENGFISGGGSGLNVLGDFVTINNITANGNRTYGAGLNVFSNIAGADKYVGVTLTGFNTFQNNQSDGLHIYSEGNITLSRVDAYDNGAVGVYADADRNLTYSCGLVYSNNRGLDLNAGGSPDAGTGIMTLNSVLSFVNAPGVPDLITYTSLLVRTRVCP